MVRRERLPFLFLHFALQTGAQGERASFCAKSALQKPARGWLLVGCAPAPALLAFPCSIACPAMGRTPATAALSAEWVSSRAGWMDGSLMSHWANRPLPVFAVRPAPPSLSSDRRPEGRMEERGKAGRHSVSPSLASATLDVLHCFVFLHLFIIEK